MDKVESFRDLVVWQKAIDLSQRIYIITQRFPKEEMFGITSQIRKAVVSIASNIAEGHGRNTTGEYIHFVGISKGSFCELETQLTISRRIGFLTEETLNDLMNDCAHIGRLLNGLIHSLQNKKRGSRD